MFSFSKNVADAVKIMSQKDSLIQVETGNIQKLTGALENLLVRREEKRLWIFFDSPFFFLKEMQDFPDEYIRLLQNSDLTNDQDRNLCIQAATLLNQALSFQLQPGFSFRISSFSIFNSFSTIERRNGKDDGDSSATRHFRTNAESFYVALPKFSRQQIFFSRKKKKNQKNYFDFCFWIDGFKAQDYGDRFELGGNELPKHNEKILRPLLQFSPLCHWLKTASNSHFNDVCQVRLSFISFLTKPKFVPSKYFRFRNIFIKSDRSTLKKFTDFSSQLVSEWTKAFQQIKKNETVKLNFFVLKSSEVRRKSFRLLNAFSSSEG